MAILFPGYLLSTTRCSVVPRYVLSRVHRPACSWVAPRKQESVFKASSELGSDEGYHWAIESVTVPKCVSSDCRHRQDRLLARLREEHVWKVLRLHVCCISVLVGFFHPLSFEHMDTLRLRRKWIHCDADTLTHQNVPMACGRYRHVDAMTGP